ncbi:efflux RND transporter periplasmic adaptor subunit [Thiohalorhabdus methylotrophus]|uniref:Efflux RND transporter periplasmic adaptor subunit n=1 Tax=Thiohalorhabdus methylotrophus TaxID=3242694 RepID=A0ABV4TR03_9GAMM
MKRMAVLLAATALLGTASTAAAEMPFETLVVEPSALDRIRSAPGTVESRLTSRISAEVSGQVEAMPYEVGDSVAKGDTLVRLDDSALQAQLAVAQAALRAAEARVKEARQNFQRIQNLYEQNSASEQQLDKATAALDSAEAQRGQARAEIRKLRIQLDKTTIKAPVDGVMMATHIEEGELAQPGAPLVTVLDPRRLRLTARVQESRIPELMGDGEARAWIPALGKRLPVERVTVVPQGDPQTHTFQVRLRLPKGASVSAGMFGRAEFLLGSYEALVVPDRAVVHRTEITGVYVVEDGRVAFRLVELGERTDKGREVLAGLRPGERVALEPNRALRYLKEQQPAASGGDSGASH